MEHGRPTRCRMDPIPPLTLARPADVGDAMAPQPASPARPAGDPSRSAVSRAADSLAHLFTGTSQIQATRRFLRRQLWAWPVIAAVILGAVGWWVNRLVEDSMRDQRAADLNT